MKQIVRSLSGVSCALRILLPLSVGLIVQPETPTAAAVNEWTKPASGYWEEPYWSLGTLPGMDQDTVVFRNPGWKALAIGASTTANYSNSLAINHLTVEAPADSSNQLLLNYAGLDVPLFVNSDLILGTNGSLVSYYSALRGGIFYLSAPATFSEGSTVMFSAIVVGANASAELNLTNSSLSTGLLILSQGAAGTLNQSGGSNQVSTLEMHAGSAYTLSNGRLIANSLDLQSLGGTGLAQFTVSEGCMEVQGPLRLGLPQSTPDARGEFLLEAGCFRCSEMNFLNGKFTQTGGTNMTPSIALPWLDNSQGDYFLSGGTLISSNVSLGAVLSPSTPPGRGNFAQSGGVHTNLSMGLFGEIRRQAVNHYGSYSLSGGLLVSDAIRLDGGVFTQNGGTNYTQELVLDEAGAFSLNGGELATSNSTVTTAGCVRSDFIQNGGSHIVQNRLLLEDWAYYALTAGTLTTANIEIGPGASLSLGGGMVSNSGVFTIRGGSLNVIGQKQALGQLQVIGVSEPVCHEIYPGARTLSLDFWGGASREPVLLRFRDSRDVAWSGLPLSIFGWRPPANGFGGDHIYIGTNSQGLTSDQLSRVIFYRPYGVSSNYSAAIMPSGELVPAPAQDYFYTTTNGTVAIMGYIGSGGDATIPSTINNLPVTSIGDQAFQRCYSLTSVTIPDGVITIGGSAFYYCISLARVAMGNGVTRIGDYAFYNCTSLASVTILNSVTSIGDYAFWSCTSLTGVTIPNHVTSIGNSAFYSCTSLASVTIGNSVTTIGICAFSSCTSLTSVMIGKGVTTIGSSAFAYSTNLAGVYFQGNAPSADSFVFYGANNATVYYLPGTTDWDPDFAGCPTASWFLPNPVILDFRPSFGLQTNRFGFIISWATNVPVVVEACTDLANGVWLPVSTNTLSDGWSYFSDPQWANDPGCFYRVRSPRTARPAFPAARLKNYNSRHFQK